MISSIINITEKNGTKRHGQIIDDVILIYDIHSGDFVKEDELKNIVIGWNNER